MSKDNLQEESKFISLLENTLKTVRAAENPEKLNRFRKLFKKTIPLTMRSYVAAYLAKTASENNVLSKPHKSFNKTKTAIERSLICASKSKVFIPEEKASSLFISIGRKRGVFPKDIISFIIQNTGVDREHIGEIRILGNYSFVQVASVVAETIIGKLNNSVYRGKPVAVSYSKKQDIDCIDGKEESLSQEYNLTETTAN